MPEHGSSPNLDKLRQETGCEWQHLATAAALSQRNLAKIAESVRRKSLVPADCELVLYGSIARNECTGKSDCDWTLLVDGMANGDHHKSVIDIRNEITNELELAKPGATDTFGSMTISHDVVHQIGGQEDTNQITTRRVLLLLESIAIPGEEPSLVRNRVVYQIIDRYLEGRQSLGSSEGDSKYPRFLLNDVVRYWRTMAVDYAKKERDNNREKCALRNIKLRLSRKLTFSSGMLTCFDSVLRPTESHSRSSHAMCSEQDLPARKFLFERANTTPLEILAKGVLSYEQHLDKRIKLAKKLFDSYDEFIGILDNEGLRTHLKSLSAATAVDDKCFNHACKLGRTFQSGLLTLFFETDDELSKATREYGVF